MALIRHGLDDLDRIFFLASCLQVCLFSRHLEMIGHHTSLDYDLLILGPNCSPLDETAYTEDQKTTYPDKLILRTLEVVLSAAMMLVNHGISW